MQKCLKLNSLLKILLHYHEKYLLPPNILNFFYINKIQQSSNISSRIPTNLRQNAFPRGKLQNMMLLLFAIIYHNSAVEQLRNVSCTPYAKYNVFVDLQTYSPFTPSNTSNLSQCLHLSFEHFSRRYRRIINSLPRLSRHKFSISFLQITIGVFFEYISCIFDRAVKSFTSFLPFVAFCATKFIAI